MAQAHPDVLPHTEGPLAADSLGAVVRDTEPAELEDILAASVVASALLRDSDCSSRGRALRSRALRGVADALDAAGGELVEIAMAETSLPEQRLVGEVARTTGQLRMFADGLDEGSWLDIIIDTARPESTPPGPDLRRIQRAVGPVVVFAASNFPFAFSVAGGDVASALAAGCPVVVKVHPGHPQTSIRTAAVVTRGLAEAGMPAGSFALVHGQDAGVTVLRDPRIAAASFTGSEAGGRALFDIANGRDVPIPFYAEMGSLNPVFVSSGAVAARGEEIATDYVASYLLGLGQFCTKPGLLFLPRGHGLTDRLADAVQAVAPGRLLMDRIHDGHRSVRDALAARPGVRTLVQGDLVAGTAGGTLLLTDVQTLRSDQDALLTECFGPTSIVVEYADVDEALAAARLFPGCLTATVHAEAGEEFGTQLLDELSGRAGRLVWNGWPTGVTVSWAMHHGGPYPATTSPEHTSVGMTAIRRFLRPVCYQDCPQELLPDVLRDANNSGIPRRIDGRLNTQDVSSE